MNERGFTLVELAIVMTIIGLLIGGILKGQELMQNASITANIAQVKSVQASIVLFRDQYSHYPGDFPSALTQLPNCTLATMCANGNGNTILGVVLPHAWEDVDSTIAAENTQFWKHLMLADMISGVTPTGGPAPAWGETHPASKLYGGFHAVYGPGNLCYNDYCPIKGLLLLNRNTANGARPSGLFQGIRPRIAALIDRKMDDGYAGRGSVQAISDGYTNGCGIANSGLQGPTGYAETMSAETCELIYQM